MSAWRSAAAPILAALALLLSACGGQPTTTPALNPTVPPATPTPRAPLTLGDLPAMPDALTVTPGDRFSMQTTHSAPAQVEAYYAEQLTALGLTLAERQEDVPGMFGRGRLLTFRDRDGAAVYVMILPEFENGATGVLLTLDGELLGQ